MSLALDAHRERLARLRRMSGRPVGFNKPEKKPEPPPSPPSDGYIPVTYKTPGWDQWGQSTEKKIIPLNLIMRAVCEFFGITKNDLLSARRRACEVRHRQIAMYLMREMTLASLPRIGAAMNRDHTTIYHGIEKIESRLGRDPELDADISILRQRIERAVCWQ